MDETKWYTYIFLEHEYYICRKCGLSFCGKDGDWAYHECDCPDEKFALRVIQQQERMHTTYTSIW
jgi:rubrerythrin